MILSSMKKYVSLNKIKIFPETIATESYRLNENHDSIKKKKKKKNSLCLG